MGTNTEKLTLKCHILRGMYPQVMRWWPLKPQHFFFFLFYFIFWLYNIVLVLNSLLDSVGEGEGGMIWENGIETCIISCVKRVASPGSMHDTGCLGLVHWDDPEGWNGEGGGFRMGNTCIPVADSFRYLAKLIQYCKV